MKEKILAIMKPLYASKGFKSDELESIAELVGNNLKADSTDEQIKQQVDAFSPIADLMQKVGNRYATGVESKFKGWKSQDEINSEIENAKKNAIEEYVKLNPKAVELKDEKGDVVQPDANNLGELIKAMQKQQSEYQTALQKQMSDLIGKQINEAFRPYRERTEKEYLANLLNSNDRVKSMPETFRKGYTLDKEENLDALVGKMETEYAQLKQELLNSGEFATPPTKGNEFNDEDGVVTFLNGMGKSSK